MHFSIGKNWSLANVFQHKILLEVIPLKNVPQDEVPIEIENVLGKLLICHQTSACSTGHSHSVEQNYSLGPKKDAIVV